MSLDGMVKALFEHPSCEVTEVTDREVHTMTFHVPTHLTRLVRCDELEHNNLYADILMDHQSSWSEGSNVAVSYKNGSVAQHDLLNLFAACDHNKVWPCVINWYGISTLDYQRVHAMIPWPRWENDSLPFQFFVLHEAPMSLSCAEFYGCIAEVKLSSMSLILRTMIEMTRVYEIMMVVMPPGGMDRVFIMCWRPRDMPYTVSVDMGQVPFHFYQVYNNMVSCARERVKRRYLRELTLSLCSDVRERCNKAGGFFSELRNGAKHLEAWDKRWSLVLDRLPPRPRVVHVLPVCLTFHTTGLNPTSPTFNPTSPGYNNPTSPTCQSPTFNPTSPGFTLDYNPDHPDM